jgi:hypothetical protein
VKLRIAGNSEVAQQEQSTLIASLLCGSATAFPGLTTSRGASLLLLPKKQRTPPSTVTRLVS